MRLGAHMSIAGGVYRAFALGRKAGCDAIQIFLKSSRQWKGKPYTAKEIERFHEEAARGDIYPVVAHAAYLINLGTPQEELWLKSREALLDEVRRSEVLGVPYLVLHPGSHTGSGEEAGLARVAEALGWVHEQTPGYKTQILLETTAGQGTNLGYRFEHLAWLLENTPQGERLGVCYDTCHVFAAGYEIRTPEGYQETMDAFDAIIGLERLKVVHLNDSKGDLGSRKDRHAHIGQGKLGLEAFRLLLNDERLAGLPGLLETPKSADLHEDIENLRVLRSLRA
ncbi:MAG: deoxyribonuclease IV [Chloroflexi bacterium]|nr:MAG: deoxyribonuclease IV [Chloroflexota bacterium]